jgi:hypothetical protein
MEQETSLKPLIWARIVFSRDADLVLHGLDQQHRQRLAAVIAVIKNGPEDGLYAGEDDHGHALRQMSAADTHVIYRATCWAIGRVLLIYHIEIRDWDMLDDGPTL